MAHRFSCRHGKLLGITRCPSCSRTSASVRRRAACRAIPTPGKSCRRSATVSRVSDEQLFYLMSRGLSEEEAMAMIVRGFVEPIAKELPMEYALELNRLIELQMEGSVG